jgi:hypothetical protein
VGIYTGLKGRKMENKSFAPEEKFRLVVGNAIDRVLEEIELVWETAKADFAQAVKNAAAEHGVDEECVSAVLASFAGNSADISSLYDVQPNGALTVWDALRCGYDELLGRFESERVHKESVVS